MHALTGLAAFSHLDDPRCRRGVRHPFLGMVVLMLLGMLPRIREMEVLVHWATIHWATIHWATVHWVTIRWVTIRWDQLGELLGFDRGTLDEELR